MDKNCKDDILYYNIQITNITIIENNTYNIEINVSIRLSSKIDLLKYKLSYKYSFGYIELLKINDILIYDDFYSCSVKEKFNSITEINKDLGNAISYDLLLFIKHLPYSIAYGRNTEKFINEFNDDNKDLYKEIIESCTISEYIDNNKKGFRYSPGCIDDMKSSINYSLNSLGRDVDKNFSAIFEFEKEDAKEIVDSFIGFIDTLCKISDKYSDKLIY